MIKKGGYGLELAIHVSLVSSHSLPMVEYSAS